MLPVDTFLAVLRQQLLAEHGIPPFDASTSMPSKEALLLSLIRWSVQATEATAPTGLAQPDERAAALAAAFWQQLPGVWRALQADAAAISQRDPAATSVAEVLCCYPAIVAILSYRVAHLLHQVGVPLLPRIITERAHSLTGIDIHPAATIGRAFAIDHGTGIVIGATAIIGNHVMLYQGVTLGAKNFQHDTSGRLLDQPRHPIIQDNVTIYANTTVLGRITIGHDAVVGGNLWITHDVEPCSVVRQSKPIKQIGFTDGEGI